MNNNINQEHRAQITTLLNLLNQTYQDLLHNPNVEIEASTKVLLFISNLQSIDNAMSPEETLRKVEKLYHKLNIINVPNNVFQGCMSLLHKIYTDLLAASPNLLSNSSDKPMLIEKLLPKFLQKKKISNEIYFWVPPNNNNNNNNNYDADLANIDSANSTAPEDDADNNSETDSSHAGPHRPPYR